MSFLSCYPATNHGDRELNSHPRRLKTMSTTEALRKQLDQLRTQYNLLDSQNRRLREEQPQRVEELDLEGEIAETRQENVGLVQTIATLEAKLEDQERGAGAQTDELEESVETLTGEATALRSQVDMMATELEARVVWATSRAETAEEHVKRLEERLERLRRDIELERLQAVVEETLKWEAREARLIRRLDELEGAGTRTPREAPMDLPRDPGDDPTDREGSLDAGQTGAGVITTTMTDADRYVLTGTSIAGDKSSVTTTPVRTDKRVGGPWKLDSPPGKTDKGVDSPLKSAATPLAPPTTKPAAATDHLSMALLAQQLPPLPKFTGDNLEEDAENIEEWLEQTDLVAQGCGWNEQAKLFSVVARLRGSASGFYRSCTVQQRSSYTQLAAALRQRFTPV